MAGTHGTQTQKTHSRLKYILDNFEYFYNKTQNNEKDVLDAIRLLGVDANTLAIGKKAKVSPTSVCYVLRRFEHLILPEIPIKDTVLAKPNISSSHQFQHTMHLNGEHYVLVTEAEEAINLAATVTTPVTIIPTIIKNVSVVKHITGDTIDISLQLKNFEAFTIYDLFDFISLDANVGLVFDI
jgi:hypothetical protein